MEANTFSNLSQEELVSLSGGGSVTWDSIRETVFTTSVGVIATGITKSPTAGVVAGYLADRYVYHAFD